MSYEDDSTLQQLRNRIVLFKQQRNQLMNELIGERKQMQMMQTQMLKMKKQKQYLQGLIRQKVTASHEYDRIIIDSQNTLIKLSESTKKLLLSVDNQYGKFIQK